MHVGIPSDLFKGTVRGSQTASDVHVNEAPKVGCRLLERCRKYAIPVSSKSNRNFWMFSKAARANEKQMLNFQGIRIHFSLPDRFIGWAQAEEAEGVRTWAFGVSAQEASRCQLACPSDSRLRVSGGRSSLQLSPHWQFPGHQRLYKNTKSTVNLNHRRI